MKRLGSGWQYSVYDIGGDRVFKKFHTTFIAYTSIFFKLLPWNILKFYKIPNYARNMRIKARDSFEIIKRLSLPLHLLGNPIFKGLDYEQDNVKSIRKFLFKNRDKGIEVINKFVLFNKDLIKHGLIDKSFNIGNNFGINKKGDVILIDLGELLSGKEMEDHISKKPWSKDYVLNSIPKEFKDYFLESMNKNFLL